MQTALQRIAKQMADAIREWNRAKQERESWRPIPGQIPPVDILGSAKKANAMLTAALEEYELYERRIQKGVEIAMRVYEKQAELQDALGDCLCPADGHSEMCPVHKVNSSPR